jgi:hypothetical protein
VAHLLDDDGLERAFEEMAGFECAFAVTEFHLYVHRADHGWKATHDFVLLGPGT